jgi:Flp pilus assembly pilin Flp
MLKQFLRDEQGQTTVEYLLIIAVIVVVISVFGKVAQAKMKDTVEAVFAGINKKIQQLMNASLQ